MKKIIFILTLAITTLTVSYAYPADQQVYNASFSFADWKSVTKNMNNAEYTGTLHYYLEVRYTGKAAIHVFGANFTDYHQFNYSGTYGLPYDTWNNGSYSYNKAKIQSVRVEVQINGINPAVLSTASSRWEW